MRQNQLVNSDSTGKISRRPNSMENDSRYFELSVSIEKFEAGPTKPNPGPTPPMVVRIEPKEVAQLFPKSIIIKVPAITTP